MRDKVRRRRFSGIAPDAVEIKDGISEEIILGTPGSTLFPLMTVARESDPPPTSRENVTFLGP